MVLTPRRWRQILEKLTLPRDDGVKKPDRRGEPGVSRKTIRAGKAGYSGEPVATNSRVFFYTRGCGCRLSLRPLLHRGAMICRTRAVRAAGRMKCVQNYPPSSFRGARQRELRCAIAHRRIHGAQSSWEKWIPGLRLSAHPGMTMIRHVPALSPRQYARVVRLPFCPEIRGRRECRAPVAPAALRAKIKSTQASHHGHTGDIRHSPRNGFNGLFHALPGDRACCHRHP